MPPEENDAQAEAIARGDVLPTGDAEMQQDLPLEDEASEAPKEPVAADAEEEEAPAVEAKDEAEEEDKPKEHLIPKARFDEALTKERAQRAELAARLKQYEEREQQQVEAEDYEASQARVKELLAEHSSLLADGELEKASEVMGAVLQLRDDMQAARMTKQADNARNSAKIEVQYDRTVEKLEEEYPEINPDSDAFDQTAVRRVQMMVTGIMQNEGKNPAEALLEATDILLKPLKEAKGETLRDKPSADAVEKGMRRTQQQIDKNVRTAAAQPPATDEIGQDHDKSGGAMNADAISKMSWEEFVQVPDSELSKMRGDYLN